MENPTKTKIRLCRNVHHIEKSILLKFYMKWSIFGRSNSIPKANGIFASKWRVLCNHTTPHPGGPPSTTPNLAPSLFFFPFKLPYIFFLVFQSILFHYYYFIYLIIFFQIHFNNKFLNTTQKYFNFPLFIIINFKLFYFILFSLFFQ